MACGSEQLPKPRGYFRIDFPEKDYRMYQDSCPYSFEYPTFAEISPDNDALSEPCWININYPAMKAQIHITYMPVAKNAAKYLEESRSLAYKHTIKADAIDEKIYMDSLRNVYGTLYNIEGNAASSIQFYLTDSVKHFLRGALYFNVEPNKDSLAPVVNFINKDIEHLIETFQWNKKE